MASTDPIRGVVAFLRADAGISGLVGTRVFAEELPADENDDMPRKAILVTSAGGTASIGQSNNFGDRRLAITCYGATKSEARQLFKVVRDLLKNMGRTVVNDSVSTTVMLHWARISADGSTGREPKTDWPFCGSTWQVLASDVPAS